MAGFYRPHRTQFGSATGAEMRITGAKELEEVLKQLPAAVAGQVVRSALMAGAEVIRKEAETLAPIGATEYKDWKGKTHTPGTLRKSLRKWSVRQSEHSDVVAVGVPKGSKGFYGTFVEFGTKHMAGNRFLTRAYEAKAAEAMDIIGKKLGDGIERAAKKLAGPYRKSGWRK